MFVSHLCCQAFVLAFVCANSSTDVAVSVVLFADLPNGVHHRGSLRILLQQSAGLPPRCFDSPEMLAPDPLWLLDRKLQAAACAAARCKPFVHITGSRRLLLEVELGVPPGTCRKS